MLTNNERGKRKIALRNPPYFYQRAYERGGKLFCFSHPPDCIRECFEAIRDEKKSVIIKDERGINSTHHCIFISDSGGYVCIPCHITDEWIYLITLKDIREDERPGWYVRKYNEVARMRGLPLMNQVI